MSRNGEHPTHQKVKGDDLVSTSRESLEQPIKAGKGVASFVEDHDEKKRFRIHPERSHGGL